MSTMRHGTESGYTIHRRRGEEPCQPCRDGSRAAQHRRAEAKRNKPDEEHGYPGEWVRDGLIWRPTMVNPPDEREGDPVARETCGTHTGYKAHRRHGERSCRRCLKAYREYERWRTKRPASTPRECGTESAYRQHLLRGEKACGDCRRVHAANQRERRLRREQGRAA